MTLITILIVHSNVKAASTNFYEAEKIDNIYTKSVKNGTTHFQKSRFFRRKSDNKAAYCIEPFNFFDESASYETSINPNNIDQNTWERMSLIAYYGYNYQGHTDNKWYAITQLMLWQTVDKDADFYFTDYLNGNKIEKFTNEIAEINDLVNNHYIKPSFANKTININIKNNKIIDANKEGELCVRGTSLAMGYYNNPEKTAAAFVQNPLNHSYPETIYRTGDLVFINNHGEIVFKGRKDSLIKHMGYRIELGEIEHVIINTLKLVKNGCVVYNHQRKEITLYYEAVNELTAAEFRKAIGNALPKYMIPVVYHHLDELKRNPNGKIDRLYYSKIVE